MEWLPVGSDFDQLKRLIIDLDEFLTEKPRSFIEGQFRHGSLDAGNYIEELMGSFCYYMSDGGYSRLYIRIFPNPNVWLDMSLSSEKSKAKWDLPESQRIRSEIVDLLNKIMEEN